MSGQGGFSCCSEQKKTEIQLSPHAPVSHLCACSELLAVMLHGLVSLSENLMAFTASACL